MAKNIPKALATFVSTDSDTARLSSNLQAALQPLLDFQNKWFSVKGAMLNIAGGVLSAGQAVLTSFRSIPDGTLLAPGLAFLSNGTIGIERQGTGNSEQLNFLFNGVTFLSITKGGYIWTNFSATSSMFFNRANGNLVGSINNAGTVNFPSFVSGNGFKFGLPPFYFWGNGGTTNTSFNFLSLPVVSMIGTQTASFAIQAWTAPRAGSVTGVSVYFDRSNTVPFNFRLQIAGTQTSTVLLNVTSNNYATIAKGTSGFTFTAGQVIAALYQTPTASAVAAVVTLNIEVELGA